jgi:glycosyltransferase involved in cell wall biosynthesis
MNQKILFICDFYYPNATSIGVCTHKVAKALQKEENEVHVLTFGAEKNKKQGEYEGIPYYCIKKRFHERCIAFGNKIGGIFGETICIFGRIKCRLWQILWFPFFRMDSIIVPLRYYKAISKLHKQNRYDMIISTFAPFESMLATYWFKKKHSSVLFCLYILDTISHTGKTNFISEKLNDKMGWRWEKKIFPRCDRIINLRCHEKHHQQERYEPYRNKMVFSDIPLMEENVAISGFFDAEHIHFVYTGRILKVRSSSFSSSLFEKISINNPYILHYFSFGDEEEMIKAYEKKTNGRIKRHGLVPQPEIPIIQKSADILVSIGNSYSEMITSKIFEYISTGNRIVHFQKDDSDTAVLYYKKYGNVLILDERDEQKVNIEKLKIFLSSPYEQINFQTLKELFPENLPEHTADLIVECFKKEKID